MKTSDVTGLELSGLRDDERSFMKNLLAVRGISLEGQIEYEYAWRQHYAIERGLSRGSRRQRDTFAHVGCLHVPTILFMATLLVSMGAEMPRDVLSHSWNSNISVFSTNAYVIAK